MSTTIFKTIADVQADIAKRGISKEQLNKFDQYRFRGIDDVYNALSPILADHGLSILPAVQSYHHEMVQTSGGKAAVHTHVTVNYNLSNREGDQCTACIVGEAQDRGDKGMNKAMSAAYKLLCFQLFCIPVEGESHDTESESIQVAEERVGDYELVTIREELSRQNLEESSFCGWQKIAALEEMPLNRFAHAMTALNRRRDRLAQEYHEQEAVSAQQEGRA